MNKMNPFRLGKKWLWVCATLGASIGGARAQTPSKAIYTHQNNLTNTPFAKYIDFDVRNVLPKDQFSVWAWPTNPNKTTYFAPLFFRNYADPFCWEIRFAQQYPTPIPDWSLWVNTSGGLWQKISDNHDGLFPRMRMWVKNPSNPSMDVRLSAGVQQGSGVSSGAAWIFVEQKYISQASCESGSMGIVRLLDGQVTVVRTGP